MFASPSKTKLIPCSWGKKIHTNGIGLTYTYHLSLITHCVVFAQIEMSFPGFSNLLITF